MALELIITTDEGRWISENLDRPVGHCIGDELRKNLTEYDKKGTYLIEDIRGRFRKVHGDKDTGASYYSGYCDVNLHHFVATELMNTILPQINKNIIDFQPGNESEFKFCIIKGIFTYLRDSQVDIDPDLLRFHSNYESIYGALQHILKNEVQSDDDVRPALSILKSILTQFKDLSILALIRENGIISQQASNLNELLGHENHLNIEEFIKYHYNHHGFQRYFGSTNLIVRCPARGAMVNQTRDVHSEHADEEL